MEPLRRRVVRSLGVAKYSGFQDAEADRVMNARFLNETPVNVRSSYSTKPYLTRPYATLKKATMALVHHQFVSSAHMSVEMNTRPSQSNELYTLNFIFQ